MGPPGEDEGPFVIDAPGGGCWGGPSEALGGLGGCDIKAEDMA